MEVEMIIQVMLPIIVHRMRAMKICYKVWSNRHGHLKVTNFLVVNLLVQLRYNDNIVRYKISLQKKVWKISLNSWMFKLQIGVVILPYFKICPRLWPICFFLKKYHVSFLNTVNCFFFLLNILTFINNALLLSFKKFKLKLQLQKQFSFSSCTLGSISNVLTVIRTAN